MSNQHPFWPLRTQTGTLLLTPCPGTKTVPLKESLEQLKSAGASGIITLMELDEMEKNEVTALPEHCQQLELKWFHLPIEDDSAPGAEFDTAWQQHRHTIHQLLEEGHTLALHCKGGSGRTGMIACQLLLEQGAQLEPSIEAIRALRPNALTLEAHQHYIAEIVAHQQEDSQC